MSHANADADANADDDADADIVTIDCCRARKRDEVLFYEWNGREPFYEHCWCSIVMFPNPLAPDIQIHVSRGTRLVLQHSYLESMIRPPNYVS